MVKFSYMVMIFINLKKFGVRRDIITVMCLNLEEVRHLKVIYHLIGIGGLCKNTSVLLGIFEEYAFSWFMQLVAYFVLYCFLKAI